ncbi:MAG: putative transporter [Euryarchaeota archaeon ADurb.Bin165]|nr:MAG: putative transporter [Euryarchaeota archaeon ADurb.Bin165]
MIPLQPSIPKTASLSLWQIIPLYIGSVLGSGILLLPGLTADSAGPASILAWLLMSILAIPMALSMGLLSVRFPHAGGVSYFVTKAWNADIGMLVGWFFLLSAIMAVPIIALTGAGYAAAAFGLGETGRLIITVIIFLIAAGTNFFGMRLTGSVQMTVVIATIVILVGAVVGSIHAIEPSNFTPFLPHGWISVGHAATLIFWCFLGWEAISHLTEEFEDPGRDVVRGTIIASVIISLLYLATACAVIGTGSYGSGLSEVSLIHLINLSFGTPGVIIAGIVTLFITTAPAIAYTSAAARLAYAISKAGYAPRQFSLLHSIYQTPVGGIVFLFCCFCIILAVYISGIVPLGVLIQIPNATFILTYSAGCAAGLVLMKDSRAGMIVSAISLILTMAIFCFTGWAMIWPALLVLSWAVYLKIRK